MSEKLMTQLAEELSSAPKVIITAHDRPDGDATGSVLGLARILTQLGREVHLTGCDPISSTDEFLLNDDHLEDFNAEWIKEGAVLAVLDAASPERAEVVIPWKEAGGRTLVIDHHISNSCFGDINWVDADASSSSEMVLRLADHAGWTILPDAATPLWVGIVTDTGRFTHENTSPQALTCGARLVELGAVPSKIGEKLYQNQRPDQVMISGRAAASLVLKYNGILGEVSLSHNDFTELSCSTDAAGDVVNIPRSIKGVEISLFFYEMEEGKETKLSIRAREPFDATLLAGAFNGGGHQRAAGCTVPCPLAEAREKAYEVIENIWGKLIKEKTGGF